MKTELPPPNSEPEIFTVPMRTRSSGEEVDDASIADNGAELLRASKVIVEPVEPEPKVVEADSTPAMRTRRTPTPAVTAEPAVARQPDLRAPAAVSLGGTVEADKDLGDTLAQIQEAVDLSGHNGFVGTRWGKSGEEREVIGIKETRDSKGNQTFRLQIGRTDNTGTPDVVSMKEFADLIGRQVQEGRITNFVVPDNRQAIWAGEIVPFERELSGDDTGRYFPRVLDRNR